MNRTSIDRLNDDDHKRSESGEKVTITQIANELGIAPSSVSRALNNRPGVSRRLQDEIQAYAKRVGYVPVSSPANQNAPNMIAMIIGDIRNPFYADLVFYTQKELSARGYQLCIFNSEYMESKEIEYLHIVDRFNFAGVIQMNVATEHISHVLKNLSTPVVMVNRIISSFDGDNVLLNNYEAGYVVTRHLVELGHSKIGFILGQKESSSCNQRFAGFQQALKNYNIDINPRHILQGDLTLETGLELASDFAALNDKPSAMVVSNDLTAHGFIRGCMQHGICVPDELSVASFDNISFSSIGTTTLTSIDPNVKQMAKIAVRLMIERIEHPEKETERVVLKPVLVERKSTAPFRNRSVALAPHL